MKTKRILLFGITFIMMLCMCGCWDYREYENLAMVSAVGFDTDGTTGQVTVTAQYLVPGGSNTDQGGGSKKTTGTITVRATGFSIDDALTKVQQISGKRLFYGYMQEIVLGQNAAKTITEDILGFVDRTPNIRVSAYIAVTPDTAEQVLQTIKPGASETIAKSIHNLIDQTLSSGSAYPVTILDFEERIAGSGREPVAPKITATRTENPGGSASSSSSSGTLPAASGSPSKGNASSGSASSSPSNSAYDPNAGAEVLKSKDGYFKVDGMAVFNKDALQGWLNDEESTGLGWLTNQKQIPYEVIKTSLQQDIANTITFRVTKNNCKIKVQVEDGMPVADIDADVEADMRKYAKNAKETELTPETVQKLEKELAANVRAEINQAIQKGQKSLKSDIFGIGFNFYRQNPGLWHSEYEKKWDKIFPTVKVNVNVTAKVIDTGTTVKKFSGK